MLSHNMFVMYPGILNVKEQISALALWVRVEFFPWTWPIRPVHEIAPLTLQVCMEPPKLSLFLQLAKLV